MGGTSVSAGEGALKGRWFIQRPSGHPSLAASPPPVTPSPRPLRLRQSGSQANRSHSSLVYKTNKNKNCSLKPSKMIS